MSTFDYVPRDVIAAQVATRLPLGDRNSLMKCSHACLVACQSDPAWAPMIKELFLMRKEGETCYQTVKSFYERFTKWSNRLLDASAPKGVFARIGSCVKSLRIPKRKGTSFEANRRCLQSRHSEKKLIQRRDYFSHIILGVDLEVAFHLHQTMPDFIPTRELLEKAMSQDNWPMALELAKSDYNEQEAILWTMAGKPFLEQKQSKIFEELFKTAKLSEWVRGRLFVFAAVNGNLQAVKAQLQSGLVSDRSKIVDAITSATGKDQIEIVREIIENKAVSGQLRDDAISQAIGTGNRVALSELLKLGPISLEDAVSYYEMAAIRVYTYPNIRNHHAVMRELEESCPGVAEASVDEFWCKKLAAGQPNREII